MCLIVQSLNWPEYSLHDLRIPVRSPQEQRCFSLPLFSEDLSGRSSVLHGFPRCCRRG